MAMKRLKELTLHEFEKLTPDDRRSAQEFRDFFTQAEAFWKDRNTRYDHLLEQEKQTFKTWIQQGHYHLIPGKDILKALCEECGDVDTVKLTLALATLAAKRYKDFREGASTSNPFSAIPNSTGGHDPIDELRTELKNLIVL